jgi:predicted TIM-barrel fold metal-dependent hydrolase
VAGVPVATVLRGSEGRRAPVVRGLHLVDYRPVRQARLPEHRIQRPRFPVIDAHNHLGPAFSGGWHARPVEDLLAALDGSGVEMVVDVDVEQRVGLLERMERYGRRHPQRFAHFTGLAYDAWAEQPDFGEMEAQALVEAARLGVRGIKAWKPLGLRARDPQGRVVPVDDVRLDPLWATAGRLGLPVLVHVADPIAFFEPLDERNERWEELNAHPDWHFWPPLGPEEGRARAAGEGAEGEGDTAQGQGVGAWGQGGAAQGQAVGARGVAGAETGFTPFAEILAAFDRVIGRHPGTTFIGAHVGCAAEDLALVSSMLDRHPNYHVDLSARIAELGRQPYTAREFFVRYADRVLFGTDLGFDPEMYRVHYRFLETRDESFDYSTEEVPPQGRWQIHGLGLPDEVLRQVYAGNARRLILEAGR